MPCYHPRMDDDLEHLDQAQLIAEVKALRAGIRRHRDSTGHDLCWYHPQLWALLPEAGTRSHSVPHWPQFMRGCVAFRASLDAQLPQAPRNADEFNPD